MRLVRGTLVAAVLAITAFGGMAAPAQASPCDFHGRNCYWVVICTTDFNGNVGDYVACVD